MTREEAKAAISVLERIKELLEIEYKKPNDSIYLLGRQIGIEKAMEIVNDEIVKLVVDSIM